MHPLLDHSFDVPDRHHVEVTVLNDITASGCVDYLTAADVDRDVTAIASVVIADDISDLKVASRYADTVAVTDCICTVRQIDTCLSVTVHYET